MQIRRPNQLSGYLYCVVAHALACNAAPLAPALGEPAGGAAEVARAVLDRAAAPAGEPAAQAEPPVESRFYAYAPVEERAVGTRRVEMDVADDRRIPVQLWYPAVDAARGAAEAGRPVIDFEPPGPQRDALIRATRSAGDAYSRRTMHAADAPAAHEQTGRFPLVLISHCTDCLRFGYFSIAEELAAHGFVVAAPDHVDNTLYNYWNGNSVGVDLDGFLDVRRKDLQRITDIMLDANAAVVPQDLRGRIDPDRIGLIGHSYGALTASYASTQDARLRAVVFLAMIASQGGNLPVLGEELAKRVEPVKLSKPSLFITASEDLIEVFGMNELIRQNYLDYPNETWLATLKDAGHYSVMDICGIDSYVANGCGRGIRATQFLVPFEYLDIDIATSLTAAMVTTFMEQQLNGASESTLPEIAADSGGVLTMEHRKP